MRNPSLKTRKYIYRLVNLGVGILVFKKVTSGEEAALWLLLINGALGLADVNATE